MPTLSPPLRRANLRALSGTALALAMVSIAARSAHCQMPGGFQLGTWEGTAQTGFEAGADRTRSPNTSTDLGSKANRVQGGIGIRNSDFFLIDPRVFSGTASLNLDLVKDSFGTDASRQSAHAKLIGYGIDTTAFSGLPYGGNLFAHRARTLNWQPFGRSQLDYANRGFALTLRQDSPLRERGLPFLDASATVEQQHTREETQSVLGQEFRRDEVRNLVSLDAHKGFETGDLSARYDFDDLRNSAFPQANFRSRNASVSFSRDFGAGLSKRTESRLLYSNRAGANPLSLLTAEERLRMEHYQNLSTDYSYVLSRLNSSLGSAEARNGMFGVRYKPYRDVAMDGSFSAGHQQLPNGTRDSKAAHGAIQFRRELSGNRALFARAGGRFQRDDNRMASSAIEIVDEAQSAPASLGAGGGFTLSQPFAIPATIVVVDTRGGSRIPTAAGLDYDVIQEGGSTRIVPLATSAVIQPGDPLAVSYTYAVDPSLEYSTVGEDFSAGVDLRWVALNVAHEQTRQQRISGQQDFFLQDVRRDSAQVDLRREWESGRAQAGFGAVRYDSTRLVYSQRRATQLASYRPIRSLLLSANGDFTATQYALPLHRTTSRALRLDADWYANGWTASAAISRRVFDDTLQPSEVINEGRLKARFVYGKLDFSSGLTLAGRRRGAVETRSWRLNFLVIRKF